MLLLFSGVVKRENELLQGRGGGGDKSLHRKMPRDNKISRKAQQGGCSWGTQ